MEVSKKVENYVKMIDEVIANGRYKDNWESLKDHKVPDWYRDAKFGIFIHWGLYSVAGFCEWYPRWMYMPYHEKYGKAAAEHHVATYGSQKDFGYKDFVPMFKAENFDAAQWADLFKESGAKFVMPVAEHHDGFPIYDCDFTDWCAFKMGPERDCLQELKDEFEKREIVFTASSHRAEHYWFLSGGREIDSDIIGEFPQGHIYWPSRPEPYDKQANYNFVEKIEDDFLDDFLARTCEIVDKYRPKIVYFDAWIQAECFKSTLKKFAAYYYNRALEWGEEVTINYKFDAFMLGTGVQDIERGQLADVSPYFWQNDTSVANKSWCYSVGNDYKDTDAIICDLVDIVSKNGSLLLNIGPKADGTIPEQDTHILKEIGAWLKLNGEGIYESSYWKKYKEGTTVTPEGHFTDMQKKNYTSEDFRFTYKDGVVYAFVMRWPEDGIVRIKTFGKDSHTYCGSIKNVEVLGGKNTQFMRCREHLTVKSDGISTEYPVCIKIIVD